MFNVAAAALCFTVWCLVQHIDQLLVCSAGLHSGYSKKHMKYVRHRKMSKAVQHVLVMITLVMSDGFLAK